MENRGFEPTPPILGASVRVTPTEFRRDIWYQKTGVPGLSYVCVIVRLFSHFGTVRACD